MDLKNLLGKLDIIEGSMEKATKNPTGPKFTGQWKGTDKGTPGKKLVGDSILRDLSKGKTPKTKEQELSEEFQAFLEAEFKDTVDKRPARKNARPARGHEPKSGYKTVKADEGYDARDAYELEDPKHPDFKKNYEEFKAKNPDAKLADFIAYLRSRKTKTNEDATPAALQDPIVAKVVKQMRPGLTGLDMGNEAFLYFAYELGKQRARDAWSDYLPAIRAEYEKGLSEGWESGPEEYKEPYDDADDAYDRQRQEKIDTEAEKEWAKLPKVSTYKLSGRGPNMEPNYEFGDEFDTLEQALEYRAKIMKDPKTPHPEHIGIRTITRVVNKDQTNEAVQGGGGVKDLEDYTTKRDYIYQQLADPKQVDNYAHFKQALFDLMRTAREKGIKIEESRAHKQLATWFKNRELADKFVKGELQIPTPQERRAQLKSQEKSKKKVDEYGADNNVTPYGQPTQPKIDPKQAQAVAQATQTIKAATGSSAPTTNIAKAIDAASQGKPVGQADMKALEPVMKDVATIAQDPKLASQFKTLAQQVNQSQLKQQSQAKK